MRSADRSELRCGEPRVFQLVRHHQVPETTGAGVIAEGIQWSDGSVAVRWHGAWPTVVVYETGIQAVIAVHGQSGATRVRWLAEWGAAP